MFNVYIYCNKIAVKKKTLSVLLTPLKCKQIPNLNNSQTCRVVENIWSHFWTDLLILEQDQSYDIEQQQPSGDRKWSNTLPQMRGGGQKVENRREHHIILTKYEAVPPIDVSENNPS